MKTDKAWQDFCQKDEDERIMQDFRAAGTNEIAEKRNLPMSMKTETMRQSGSKSADNLTLLEAKVLMCIRGEAKSLDVIAKESGIVIEATEYIVGVLENFEMVERVWGNVRLTNSGVFAKSIVYGAARRLLEQING